MSTKNKPPFRADHVGSLLRPKALFDAREKRAKNEISDEELRETENRCIREAVRLQEEVGLQGITDGEYRMTYFHIDFLEHLEGVAVEGEISVKFHSNQGEIDFAP